MTASEAKDTMSSDDAEYLRAMGVEFRANDGMASLENACDTIREKVSIPVSIVITLNINYVHLEHQAKEE